MRRYVAELRRIRREFPGSRGRVLQICRRNRCTELFREGGGAAKRGRFAPSSPGAPLAGARLDIVQRQRRLAARPEIVEQVHFGFSSRPLPFLRTRIVACAAASRAFGTRNGEHET